MGAHSAAPQRSRRAAPHCFREDPATAQGLGGRLLVDLVELSQGIGAGDRTAPFHRPTLRCNAATVWAPKPRRGDGVLGRAGGWRQTVRAGQRAGRLALRCARVSATVPIARFDSGQCAAPRRTAPRGLHSLHLGLVYLGLGEAVAGPAKDRAKRRDEPAGHEGADNGRHAGADSAY